MWGVSIGTAVLQTQLAKRLPEAFTTDFPQGVSIAYSAIPAIPTLHEPVQSQVRQAFAESLSMLWQVLLGITGVGLLASVFMRGLQLSREVDKKWGLDDTDEGMSANSSAMQVCGPVLEKGEGGSTEQLDVIILSSKEEQEQEVV